MKYEKTITALCVGAATAFLGSLFVQRLTAMDGVEAAIVYLAAVIGGCCYWIGSKLDHSKKQ